MKFDKRALKIQEELSDRILKLTNNGEEMVEFFLQLMRDSKVSLKYRIEATRWLADRAWGKEPTVMHVSGGGVFESLLSATDAELLSLAAKVVELPDGENINFNLDEGKVIGEALVHRVPGRDKEEDSLEEGEVEDLEEEEDEDEEEDEEWQ